MKIRTWKKEQKKVIRTFIGFDKFGNQVARIKPPKIKKDEILNDFWWTQIINQWKKEIKDVVLCPVNS